MYLVDDMTPAACVHDVSRHVTTCHDTTMIKKEVQSNCYGCGFESSGLQESYRGRNNPLGTPHASQPSPVFLIPNL